MGFGDRHTDIEGCQHSENESLDVGHEALEEVDEDGHKEADDSDAAADSGAHDAAEYEDECHEAEDHHMAGGDIGEETYHEHDGLGEDAYDLDERHEGENLKPSRDARGVENVNPIVAIAADVGDEEGDDGESGGDSEVAGDVGASREERNKAQDVAEEDEEEEGEQIREITAIVSLADHGTSDAVAHEYHEQFDDALETLGRLVAALLITCFGDEDDDDEEDNGDEDGRGGLGDAEVDGLDDVAGRIEDWIAEGVDTDDFFASGAAADETITLVIGMSMMETRGEKEVDMTVVDEDDGERDSDSMVAVVAAVVEDMPGMCVGDVPNDHRSRVKIILLFGCPRDGGQEKQKNGQEW